MSSLCDTITKYVIVNTENERLEVALDFTGNQSLLLIIGSEDQFVFEDIDFHEKDN